MDNTFDENDFVEDQDLHAREKNQSNGNTSKNIANPLRKEPSADGTGEVMGFRKFWESRYGRELSEFELQECRDNIAGLFLSRGLPFLRQFNVFSRFLSFFGHLLYDHRVFRPQLPFCAVFFGYGFVGSFMTTNTIPKWGISGIHFYGSSKKPIIRKNLNFGTGVFWKPLDIRGKFTSPMHSSRGFCGCPTIIKF